jgi:spore coat protein U-like protein
MNRRIVAGLASVLALFFFCHGTAWPGIGTSILTALAIVNANCTVATTAVQFGSYDPIGTHKTTALNATGAITLTCTKGIAPTLALSLGSHASGGSRRMSSGANFLTYELYKPAGNAAGTPCSFPGTIVWGNAGASVFSTTPAESKRQRIYNVCGTVAAGQNPAVGTYSDTVVATVTF